MEPYHHTAGMKAEAEKHKKLTELRSELKGLVRPGLVLQDSFSVEQVSKLVDLMDEKLLLLFRKIIRHAHREKNKTIRDSQGQMQNLSRQVEEEKRVMENKVYKSEEK